MLLFILASEIAESRFFLFQYISCCYLSRVIEFNRHFNDEFQYISCCYLSYSCCPAICRKKVSIHLMLLFIRNSQQGLIHRTQVSIHLMLLFIAVRFFPIGPIFSSFNTSHVVIYLKSIVRRSIFYSFQYISCCYLSRFKKHKNKLFSLFQYISCCYLSKRRDRI